MKKNILANILGKVWSVLSNFIFIPLYISILGIEGFSVISFAVLLTSIAALLDSGLTASMSRELSKAENLNIKLKTLQTLESTFLLIVCLFLLIFLFFSEDIALNFLNTETILLEEKIKYVRYISFGIVFQLLFNFYFGGLLSLEKQIKANAYRILYGLFRNGIVILIILYKPDLSAFLIWQSLISFIFAIGIRSSLFKEIQGSVSFIFNINIKILRKIRSFIFGVFLIMIVSTINTQLDKLIISKMMNSKSLAYYTLSVSVSMGIISLINPIAVAALPRFTFLFSMNRNKEIIKIYKLLSKLISIIVFPTVTILLFYPEKVIWIWTGDDLISANTAISLPWLAAGFGFLSLQYLPFNIAMANGYTKLNNILGLLSIFITIPGYWFGFQYYGVKGVAVVFFITQAITTLIYINIINLKFIFNLRNVITSFFKTVIFPFLLCVTFMLMIRFSIKDFISYNRFDSFLILSLLGIIMFLANLIIFFPINNILSFFKKKHIT
jgi:O-antigen/teichoic acid export membrane protein